MTADWNDLPIELKIMVINKLDFISRARLGACAKLEHNLIRSTIYKIDKIDIRSTDICLEHDVLRVDISSSRFPHNTDLIITLHQIKDFVVKKTIRQRWETVVTNIFNTIGSKCVVGSLQLKIVEDVKNKIDWFRNNINFEPITVFMVILGCVVDADRFSEWPKSAKVECCYNYYNGELFEKLDSYDNIVTFCFQSNFPGCMTDEKLMKLPNATFIRVINGQLTEIGITRWLKQWLIRPDFKEIRFSDRSSRPFDLLKIKAELDGFIRGVEQEYDDNGTIFRTIITLKNQSNGKVGDLRLSDGSIIFIPRNE